MKVFLDTNVIASATATRGLCADLFRTVIACHELIVSEHLIEEVRRILGDKFRAPPTLINDLVWLLRQDTVNANALPLAALPLGDPADIAIVSSALDGGADILITGDKEILALKQVGHLRIMSPRQFWDLERDQPRGGEPTRSTTQSE